MKQLEVGDILIGSRHGKCVHKIIIGRVSKTLAFSKNEHWKFKRDIVGDARSIDLYPRPSTYFGHINFQLSTPELEEKFLRVKAIGYLDSDRLRDCTTDELKKIFSIVKTAQIRVESAAIQEAADKAAEIDAINREKRLKQSKELTL